MSKCFKLFLLVLIVAAVSLACSKKNEKLVAKAVAVIKPTEGNQAAGKVTFTKVSNGVRVVAVLEGLKPGKHGFHIHEFGDCSPPDAMKAGGHFNPKHEKHGSPDEPHHHSGDLGNVIADQSGKVTFDWVDVTLTLDGAESIVGKSVVVHADPDDFVTQPSGNAGKRIGCGLITVEEFAK